MKSYILLAISLCLASAIASVTVDDRPTNSLYDRAPFKLRISGAGFDDDPDKYSLAFEPKLVKDEDYTLSVNSSAFIVLTLKSGKKWAELGPSDNNGKYLLMTELKIAGGPNELESPAIVAQILPFPTIQMSTLTIYQTHPKRLVINGTNFQNKMGRDSIKFNPSLEENAVNVFYMSDKQLLVSLKPGYQWRETPGPLRISRIDTGAGPIKAADEGIEIADVKADLEGHGVTVESNLGGIYQDSKKLTISGSGFNTDPAKMKLYFGNKIKGGGLNYTVTSASSDSLTLSLVPGSLWRANAESLPGQLILLAVDAGAGFVTMGSTEAKRGRAVATVFEMPQVWTKKDEIFQTHTHELIVKGSGFSRPPHKTTFAINDLDEDEDYELAVASKNLAIITLKTGKKWAEEEGPLKVTAIDTGAGLHSLKKGGIQIATVIPDEGVHKSGLSILPHPSQKIYLNHQDAVVIQGTGFKDGMELSFQNGLPSTAYNLEVKSDSEAIIRAKSGNAFKDSAGAMVVTKVKVGKETVTLAGGKGVSIATVLPVPTVEVSTTDRLYKTHTLRLEITGNFGLSLNDLVLSPTRPEDYQFMLMTPDTILVTLNQGGEWLNLGDSDDQAPLFVKAIDTGAGTVEFPGRGVQVAVVVPDSDNLRCDDSCVFSKNGICEDGSDRGDWFHEDDDYGYFYDDETEGYNLYYDDEIDGFYGDDDYMAALCELGTDCTDCGGFALSSHGNCDNTCRFARDGVCDDPRGTGMCMEEGSDCQDCGPAGAANFSHLVDDNEGLWYDDDDAYFVYDDDDGRPTPSSGSLGGDVVVEDERNDAIFSMMMGTVVVTASVFAAGALYVAYNYYRRMGGGGGGGGGGRGRYSRVGRP